MILNYVASGTAALKFFRHDFDITPSKQILNNILSDSPHKHSVLFNAYTEPGLGQTIFELYRDSLYNIHSDSGGLQMITRGLKTTTENKHKVYDIQSKYSNVGMCFDEIPILTSQKEVSVTNMTSRFFDPSLVREKATITAHNIKEQIKIFDENQSNCKPMLILQGNCFDSFQLWLDIICDIIQDDLKKLHGISFAGTTLGGGILEDIVRMTSSLFLKYPDGLNYKNIHFLGLGSFRRMLPLFCFKNKLSDKFISFDSTTHSHALFKGMFILDGKSIKWNTAPLYTKETILHNINKKIDGIIDNITFEDIKNVFDGSKLYQEKTGELGGKSSRFVETNLSMYSYMVSNCIENILKLEDENVFIRTIEKQKMNPFFYNELSRCNDLYDLKEWYAKYSHEIPSNKVVSIKNKGTSVANFFQDIY